MAVDPQVTQIIEGAAKQKTPLGKQYLGPLASGLTFAVLLWAMLQEMMRPDAMRMTSWCAPYIIVTSYMYCDYWLWMLHCFLDREENLKSVLGPIKVLAQSFQDHHDVPATLLKGNHLGEIEDIVSLVGAMALILGYWTSPSTKLIMAGISFWGAVGGLNHFYCHAKTHGYQIPGIVWAGQEYGMLPTPAHHKRHHTSPHQEKWNFLNGLYKFYEFVYKGTGSSYNALFVMFYTCNPVSMQIWTLMLGIFA
jgi:hypothetical protein